MGTKENQSALKVSSACANSSTATIRNNKKKTEVTSGGHHATSANKNETFTIEGRSASDKNHNKSIVSINTLKCNQKATNADCTMTKTTTIAPTDSSTVATTMATLNHSKTQKIIIPATSASTVATNAAKKIRRAFSMPRNPFQWSRKFKTSNVNSGDSLRGSGGDDGSGEDGVEGGGGSGSKRNFKLNACVGGDGGARARHGSVVSLNSYTIISKDPERAEGGGNIEIPSNGQINILRNNKKIHCTRGYGAKGDNRVLRRSSLRKFLNRLTQHVNNSINFGPNKRTSSPTISLSSSDRVPPIGGYQWPADQTPGVTGLKNHGNTCFMNAVLQCLSHTDILAEYFVLDQYKSDLKRRNKINSRKFGTKGELTEQLANVLKALWTCRNESDHSTSFKAVVDRYGSQFRSSTQHDAQEFLFWLLDKVHEDLNTATKRNYKSVKNNYGRPDEVIAAETLANHIRCNNSFVQAVFQAQFRSSLTCPRCKKQSNTFDPFHCISVQLPQLTQQTIFVTLIYNKQLPRQVKLGLTIPAGSPIIALREQLHADTGIASDHMVLVDFNETGFARVYYDTQPISTLVAVDTVYCIEVPPEEDGEEFEKSGSDEKIGKACNGFNTTSTSTTSTVKTRVSTIAGNEVSSRLLLLVANVKKRKKLTSDKHDVDDDDVASYTIESFGAPFCLRAARDISFSELHKKLLREMGSLLKSEVFAYTTKPSEMFQIRLQDPSADPNTYLEQNVEHPLLTEMIDLALSVLSTGAGPAHIKLLLEWTEPEQYFVDFPAAPLMVEHESVARLQQQKSQDSTALTLEQCLEHYTKAETLSAEDAWRCPQCQQYLPVVKTLGLWSLPDILVVHFKRFRQHQAKGSHAAKLTTMVKFPLNAFDMSPHLAKGTREPHVELNLSNAAPNYGRPSPWKKSTRTTDSRSSTLESNKRETRYDLYAVCYHQGDTLETGHYTAACKNPYDHQWYKFDDQRVSHVPNDSIEEEIISNEAYMLFYQRRSTDVSECSVSSSNSGEHWVSKIAPPPLQSVQNSEKCGKLKTNSENPNQITTATVALPTQKDIDNKFGKTVDSEQELMTQTSSDHIEEAATFNDKETLTEDITVAVEKYEPNETLNDFKNLKYVDDGTEEAYISYANDMNQAKAKDMNIDSLINMNCTKIISKSNENENVRNKIEAANNDAEIPIDFAEHERTQQMDYPINTTTVQTSASINDLRKPPCSHEESNKTITNTFIESTKFSQSLNSASAHSLKNSLAKPNASGVNTKFIDCSSVSSSTLQQDRAITTLDTNKYNSNISHQELHNDHESLVTSSNLKNCNSSFKAVNTTEHVKPSIVDCHSLNYQTYQQNWNNGSRSSISVVEQRTPQSTQNCLNLSNPFSTSSNYKFKDCNETLSSMLRSSANICSKDTLLYIDQQNHHHHTCHHHHSHSRNNHHSFMESDNDIEDDDNDAFMGSRNLWISPVTPHKLITVSPKN